MFGLIIVVGVIALFATGTIAAPSVSGELPEVGVGVFGGANNNTNTSAESGDGWLSSDEKLDEKEVEELVHKKINNYRVNQSVGRLKHDSELAEIAEYHSENMAESGYLYHESENGQTVEDRYEKFGYDCRVPAGENEYKTSGENVAKTYYKEQLSNGDYYSSPEELAAGIVEQLINSEPHRETLVDRDWRREGIGINVTQEDGKTAIYVTQNFC